MPVVVISGCHVGPSATGQCSEDTRASNDFGESGIWTSSENVPESDKEETRSRRKGDEKLEDRSLGVAVANGCGDGREPFLRVSIVFVLDNLVVVEGNADNEGSDEGRVCDDGMSPGDVCAGELFLTCQLEVL